MTGTGGQTPWHEVLAFWFPEGISRHVDAQHHEEHWRWRMHGGADEAISKRFSGLAAMAAEGGLASWAAVPEGRLALIILLDQFPRSLWRGDARAYGQDRAALRLALEGLANGHYEALPAPWFQITFTQPLGHAEGPDHLARIDRLIQLRKEIAARAPAPLQPLYRLLVEQAGKVRQIIASFGRHPHRNMILGRPSTEAEAAYLETGAFPHLAAFRE